MDIPLYLFNSSEAWVSTFWAIRNNAATNIHMQVLCLDFEGF